MAVLKAKCTVPAASVMIAVLSPTLPLVATAAGPLKMPARGTIAEVVVARVVAGDVDAVARVDRDGRVASDVARHVAGGHPRAADSLGEAQIVGAAVEVADVRLAREPTARAAHCPTTLVAATRVRVKLGAPGAR
ncbi:MAG: hypothetical protein IT379_10145 [Deltaproteobacteria bacterium]|nr:hypothetical protein [Deltaproteobacteria bacterium]